MLELPGGREPLRGAEELPRPAALTWREGGAVPWLFVDDVTAYARICDELSRSTTGLAMGV